LITPTVQPTGRELTLLRLPAVRARVGLGKSEIYRRAALGEFPAPVRLGARAVAWNAAEVEAWIAARIAERDAGRGGVA
jgi:prophage regulatory protein